MIESTAEKPTEQQRMAKAVTTIGDSLRRLADQLEALAGEVDHKDTRHQSNMGGVVEKSCGPRECDSENGVS